MTAPLTGLDVSLPEGFTVLSADGVDLDDDLSGFAVLREAAAALSGVGVFLSAVGLQPLPGGGVGHTWLTLARTPLESEPHGHTADGILLALRDSGGYVRRVSLPVGEAVSITSFPTIELPGADDSVVEVDTGMLQVHVPVEGHDELLTLTVQSTAIEAWVAVCALAAGVAKSLAWVPGPQA